MKVGWLSALSGMLLAVSRGMHVEAADVYPVKTKGVEGVIVEARTAEKWAITDVKAQSYWTPTPQEIEKAESGLRAALEQGTKNPAAIMPGPFTNEFYRARSVEGIGRVLGRSGEYRRQYIGVVVAGKRYLLLNSFPARETSLHERERYVHVMDGGDGFWRILYSVEDGKFSLFSVHGSA